MISSSSYVVALASLPVLALFILVEFISLTRFVLFVMLALCAKLVSKPVLSFLSMLSLGWIFLMLSGCTFLTRLDFLSCVGEIA